MTKYYSKQNQDRWVIEDVFQHKRDGYFVDGGAGDGVKNSNSYALETHLGWKGICIEPHPCRFPKLRANRRCHLENVCLADKERKVTFVLNSDGQVGTSGMLDAVVNSVGGVLFYQPDRKYETISVRARPLQALLEEHQAPRVIDYLSLDVEGAEYLVLKDFPFDEYVFGCITVERGSLQYLSLRQLLFKRGYELVRIGSPDDYWVHSSLGYHQTPFSFAKTKLIALAQRGKRVFLPGKASKIKVRQSEL